MISIESLQHMIKSDRSSHGHDFVQFEFKIRPSYQFAPCFDEHAPPKEWAGRIFTAVLKSGSEKSVWFSAFGPSEPPAAVDQSDYDTIVDDITIFASSNGLEKSLRFWGGQRCGYNIPIHYIMLPPYEEADEVLTAEEVGQLRKENSALKNEVGQLNVSYSTQLAEAQHLRQQRDDLRADKNRYKNPNCSKCGSTMEAKTNRANFIQFWGCKRYPTCNGTRDFNWVCQIEKRYKKIKKDKKSVDQKLHDLRAKHRELCDAYVSDPNIAAQTVVRLKSDKEKYRKLVTSELNRRLNAEERVANLAASRNDDATVYEELRAEADAEGYRRRAVERKLNDTQVRIDNLIATGCADSVTLDELTIENKQQKIRIAELECVVESTDLTNSMTDSQFLEAIQEEEQDLIPDERLEMEECKSHERMHKIEHGADQNINLAYFKWSTLQTLVRWGAVATAASIFFLS